MNSAKLHLNNDYELDRLCFIMLRFDYHVDIEELKNAIKVDGIQLDIITTINDSCNLIIIQESVTDILFAHQLDKLSSMFWQTPCFGCARSTFGRMRSVGKIKVFEEDNNYSLTVTSLVKNRDIPQEYSFMLTEELYRNENNTLRPSHTFFIKSCISISGHVLNISRGFLKVKSIRTAVGNSSMVYASDYTNIDDILNIDTRLFLERTLRRGLVYFNVFESGYIYHGSAYIFNLIPLKNIISIGKNGKDKIEFKNSKGEVELRPIRKGSQCNIPFLEGNDMTKLIELIVSENYSGDDIVELLHPTRDGTVKSLVSRFTLNLNQDRLNRLLSDKESLVRDIAALKRSRLIAEREANALSVAISNAKLPIPMVDNKELVKYAIERDCSGHGFITLNGVPIATLISYDKDANAFVDFSKIERNGKYE